MRICTLLGLVAALAAGQWLETTIVLPDSAYPNAVCYNATDNKVYSANYKHKDVTVIDGATNQIVATVPAVKHDIAEGQADRGELLKRLAALQAEADRGTRRMEFWLWSVVCFITAGMIALGVFWEVDGRLGLRLIAAGGAFAVAGGVTWGALIFLTRAVPWVLLAAAVLGAGLLVWRLVKRGLPNARHATVAE